MLINIKQKKFTIFYRIVQGVTEHRCNKIRVDSCYSIVLYQNIGITLTANRNSFLIKIVENVLRVSTTRTVKELLWHFKYCKTIWLKPWIQDIRKVLISPIAIRLKIAVDVYYEYVPIRQLAVFNLC